MDRGGEKPAEGTEEVGSAEKYLGTGRINHAGVRSLIQGGDTSSSFLCVGDMGDEPLHGMGPGCLNKRVVQQIMGRQPQLPLVRTWNNPSLE